VSTHSQTYKEASPYSASHQKCATPSLQPEMTNSGHEPRSDRD
jgi:hypothetical protein